MATDVLLDQGSDGSWVAVDAPVLAVTGHDLILDSRDRRTDPTGFRRALVHDGGDGLTVNFGGDYPGGVRLHDAHVEVHVQTSEAEVHLPRDGVAGELFVTHVTGGHGRITERVDGEVTLWLCLGVGTARVVGAGSATWVPITTGAPVRGDA